ncbi:type 12 methyltransferase [Calothrix sp. NIES-4071]|nr:type 12 methyltransferase [Calothrix sp. NIES-4071]BAZ57643.1 type 12 methyltransferase [Calothrix sp. NIES-4105]
MSSKTLYSEYSSFARILNEAWGPESSETALPHIEELLLKHLSKGANILELCCGTGQLAQKLQNKGYQVTGIDGSAEVLHYARENSPNSKFIHEDARFFKFPFKFDGVVCVDYGLNHVINHEELSSVFENVYAALIENGWFMFDLRLDKTYEGSWNNSMIGDVKDDYAWALKRLYKPEEKIGNIHITIFQLIEDNWQRADNTWLVRGYEQEEVISMLKNVGFTTVNCYSIEPNVAADDLDRVYFVCGKTIC